MLGPAAKRRRLWLLILGGLAASLSAVCLPGSTAHAAYGNLASRLPRVGSSAVQFTVSGGSTNGVGGNLLYAPDTWIKVYATGPAAKTLTINVDGSSCGGTKTFTLYKVGRDEHRGPSRAAGSLKNGCGASKSIHIPKNFLTESSREEHDGLYIGLLRVHMQGGSQVNGPLTAFKVSASGARLGSWGMYDSGGGQYVTGSSRPTIRERQYMQALLGRPSSHSEDNYKIEFKPKCDFFSGGNSRTIHLHWFDDDNNTSYQPNFKMYVTGSDGSRQKITARGGEGAPGSATITVKRDVRYTWHWDGITRVNGVQVFYPFDSGDFDLPCPSKGWKLNTTSKPSKNAVAFQREDIPAGPDTKPSKPSENKPSGYYWHNVTDHKDCGDYGSAHPNARHRCNLWNTYYTRLHRYHARQQARENNRDHATAALRGVTFRHKVGNVSKNGQKRWDTVLAGDYKARVYKKVIDHNGHVRKDWTQRFTGDGHGGKWSAQLAKRVYKLFKGQATTVPLGDAALKTMLEDPHQGDRYCEKIVAHPGSSTGGPDATSSACVRLAPSDEPVCEPWQVNDNNFIRQVDGNGTPITGSLGTGVNDAWVGERYAYYYEFGKDGPADQTGPINFYYGRVGVDGPLGNPPAQVPVGGDGTRALGAYNPVRGIGPFSARDGGRYFYDMQTHRPTESGGTNDCGDNGAGAWLWGWIHVPWYYQLRAQVAVSDEPIVQQGTPLHVDPQTVLNSIDHGRGDGDRYNTCANAFDWHLRTTAQKPDTPTVREDVPPGNQDGHKNPRDICPNGNPGSAQALSAGTSIDTTHFPAGTKLCVHLTISPSTEGGGSTSAGKCTIVVKAPKVQFWNSDVHAGRHFEQPDNNPTCGQQMATGDVDITTSGAPTSVASQNLYGSWVEYGAFASGTISNFGSAAQNKTGGYDAPGQRLTFGNDGQLGQFGYANWCIPNYDKLIEVQHSQAANLETLTGSTIDANVNHLAADHYYTSQQTGTVRLRNLGAIAANQRDITINLPKANLVIDGATIKPGVRLVIHAKGSVTIRGSLRYQGSGYHNIDDIPRVIIIAGGTVTGDPTGDGLGLMPDIVLDEDATRVDAWLIAHGTLYTCDTDPASFDYHSKHCAKQLRLNGPVAAHDIKLRRTFGADLTKLLHERGPAEVFNLNPDGLLGSYSASQRDYFVDVYQRDLPPRY